MEYAERLHILKDTKNVIKSIMMYEKTGAAVTSRPMDGQAAAAPFIRM